MAKINGNSCGGGGGRHEGDCTVRILPHFLTYVSPSPPPPLSPPILKPKPGRPPPYCRRRPEGTQFIRREIQAKMPIVVFSAEVGEAVLQQATQAGRAAVHLPCLCLTPPPPPGTCQPWEVRRGGGVGAVQEGQATVSLTPCVYPPRACNPWKPWGGGVVVNS